MKYYIAIINNTYIIDGGGHETEEEAREYIENFTCLPYRLDIFVNKQDYESMVRYTWNWVFTNLVD
jgi:hypothetical protein|nr:MAG TPA: hypothetical protein [Caudoviricetes sp.]